MACARRIVSLISSATEILYLLGLGDRVVGVSHECDYPPEVAHKPRLTRSLVDAAASSRAIDDQVRTMAVGQTALYEIDVEQLALLHPELIITQAQCDVCAVRYEDVAAAVRETPALRNARILALNPQSIGDVLNDIERVGQATGDDAVLARAQAIKARFSERLAARRAKTAQLYAANPLRALCLEWIDPPMVAANWIPELVTLAGGASGLSAGAGQHSGYAEWREIIDYNPQVIVIMPCGFDLERAIVEAQVLPRWPHWQSLSAVRDRRVFAVDGNAYFNRSGPRLMDSLEILGHLFHPEHYAMPTLDAARAWARLETRDGSLVRIH